MKAKVKESKMTKKVQEHKTATPHKHPHSKIGEAGVQRLSGSWGVNKKGQVTGTASHPITPKVQGLTGDWKLNKQGQVMTGGPDKPKPKLTNLKGSWKNNKALIAANNESVNPRSVTLENFRTLMEQDLDQAELVLASKDMVDRLQKMAEDLAGMQVEDLMPLVDAMRESFGTEQANMFSQTADATLAVALETIKTTREGIDQAVLVLTGEGAPTNDMMGGEMPAGDMGEPMAGDEMAIPAEDEFAGDEAAAGVEGEPLGRIPKESVQLAKTLLLQHAQNGKLSKASIKEAAQILAQKKNQ
jgi:hypothetical protein